MNSVVCDYILHIFYYVFKTKILNHCFVLKPAVLWTIDFDVSPSISALLGNNPKINVCYETLNDQPH